MRNRRVVWIRADFAAHYDVAGGFGLSAGPSFYDLQVCAQRASGSVATRVLMPMSSTVGALIADDRATRTAGRKRVSAGVNLPDHPSATGFAGFPT